MKKSFLEYVIAFLITLATCWMLFYVYTTHMRDAPGLISMCAEFDTVNGLSVGAPVKINGVTVGSVKKIMFNKEKKAFSVYVYFAVDKNLHLPTDSEASIISESLFGNKVLAIIPGVEDNILKEHDVIEYTSTAPSLEEMIGQFLFQGSLTPNTDKKVEKTPEEENISSTEENAFLDGDMSIKV